MRQCIKDVCIYDSTDWNKLEFILTQIYGKDDIKVYNINNSMSGGCKMYRIFKIKDKIVAFVLVSNIHRDDCRYPEENIYNKVDIVFSIEKIETTIYGSEIKSKRNGIIQNFV